MQSLPPESVSADEAACARLCAAFVSHIDARRYERVLDLFTHDAIFDRMGQVLQGRDAIGAFLQARPTTVETRHLCANVLVDVLSAQDAVGTCSVLFFQGQAAADGSVQAMGPPAVVEYHDKFRRTAQSWCIQERRIRMAMKPAPVHSS